MARTEIVTFTGPASAGFAEDTIRMHKDHSPTAMHQLVLQNHNAAYDWGAKLDEMDESDLVML
jgi:hypothetical protein